MGNQYAKEKKNEQAILRNPEKGEASELYWACRHGDVDSVRRILSQSNYSEVNRLERNGSTALHAATYYGRVDVVRILLLEYGVEHHRRNLHGLTAYEEAIDEEIRQMFLRPNKSRFCNAATDETKDLFTLESSHTPNNDEEIPNDVWIQGKKNEIDVQFHQAILLILNTVFDSAILRALYVRLLSLISNEPSKAFSFSGCVEELQTFFNKHVPATHSQYSKAQRLFQKCLVEKKVQCLLRIYTLETPFFGKLASEDMSFHLYLPILLKLPNLKNLAFEGHTFRGLSMSEKTFKAYQWAYHHKTSALVTQTFCSSSKEKSVAENFAIPISDLIPVLMVFNFPKACNTAIKLYKATDKEEPISDIEEEKEVLIMPMTMFRVIQIEKDNLDRHVIYLENIPATLSPEFLSTVHKNPEILENAMKNL